MVQTTSQGEKEKESTSNLKNPSRTSRRSGLLSPFLLSSCPLLLLKSCNSDLHESFGFCIGKGEEFIDNPLSEIKIK